MLKPLSSLAWDDSRGGSSPLALSGSLVKPWLPKPTCRVMLVCGPPAAGKTTYVKEHAKPEDIVIDYDLIGISLGFGRNRPDNSIVQILRARNERLAALSQVSSSATAWVIVGAPSSKLRKWWQDALDVKPEDVVLLMPGRREADP